MAINLNGETLSDARTPEREGAAAVVGAMLTTLSEALGGFDQRLAHLEQAVGQALFEAGAESKALVLRLDEVVGRAATRVEARVDDALSERGGDTDVLDALAALATRTGTLFDRTGERIDALERLLAEGLDRAEQREAERARELEDGLENRLTLLEQAMAARDGQVAAMLETLGVQATARANELASRLEAVVETRLASRFDAIAGAQRDAAAAAQAGDDAVGRALAELHARMDSVDVQAGDAVRRMAALQASVDERLAAGHEVVPAQLAEELGGVREAVQTGVADNVAAVREAMQAHVTENLAGLAERMDAGHRNLANYLRELLGVGLQRIEAVAASVSDVAARNDAALEVIREETVTLGERTKVAIVAASDQDKVVMEAATEQVVSALGGLQESYEAQASRAAALSDALEQWRNDMVASVADVRDGARDVLARVSDSLDDLGRHLTALTTRTEPTGAMAAVADRLAERLESRTDGVRQRVDAVGGDLARKLESTGAALHDAADGVRGTIEGLRAELEGLLIQPTQPAGDGSSREVLDLLARLGELVSREGELLTQRVAAVSISVESTRSLLAGFLEDGGGSGRSGAGRRGADAPLRRRDGPPHELGPATEEPS